jgi:hypothetical protein
MININKKLIHSSNIIKSFYCRKHIAKIEDINAEVKAKG